MTDTTARNFFDRDLYSWSETEKRALRLFFTNATKRVFIMHLLPMAVGDVLLSMYSRLKHPKGLRGIFASNFLPQFLAASFEEVERDFGGDVMKYLKAKGVDTLDAFVAIPAGRVAFEEFLGKVTTDPDYIQRFCESKKVQVFLRMWLDKYGHNSIARMAGGVWVCTEQISIRAAKSVEWTRPGSGYIELSTRYVDMAGKELYPIAEELAAYGVDPDEVVRVMELAFRHYRTLQGENFSGIFPSHLRTAYGHLFPNPKDLEAGVFGETCDVLGNFLPAATLTSVGISSSGEALPQLVKHLLLDDSPENRAIAERIASEGLKLGLNQFLRHVEPTPWQTAAWEYLSTDTFPKGAGLRAPYVDGRMAGLPPREWVEGTLLDGFSHQRSFATVAGIDDVIANLRRTPRGEYDKLPNHFERVGVSFKGAMSFRGWRDLQRQGYCTHYRTYLTPELGFYRYDKNAPAEFFAACEDIHRANLALYRTMKEKGVPDALAEYPLSLGNLIGFQISGNLAQMEFSDWQRSKYSVNHEVRQIFLGIEGELRKAYPWWSEVSRADTVPAYVFARGDLAVPLESASAQQ